MKAANILISNRGILQIADFGLARHYDGETPVPGQGNGKVCTLATLLRLSFLIKVVILTAVGCS